MDKAEDGVKPVSKRLKCISSVGLAEAAAASPLLKRLKAVAGVVLPSPGAPSPGAAIVSKSASLAQVFQFRASEAEATGPVQVENADRNEQTLGSRSVDVKPSPKAEALIASLPTPARWRARALANDTRKDLVVHMTCSSRLLCSFLGASYLGVSLNMFERC